MFKFLWEHPLRSQQFYSWNVETHFPCRATRSNRKIIAITGNNIFRQRCRGACLRSLIISCRKRDCEIVLVSVVLRTVIGDKWEFKHQASVPQKVDNAISTG